MLFSVHCKFWSSVALWHTCTCTLYIMYYVHDVSSNSIGVFWMSIDIRCPISTHTHTHPYLHKLILSLSLSLSFSLSLSLSLSLSHVCLQKDEVYLNLVLDFVPDTVYRVIRHHSKARQTMPILYVKVRRAPTVGHTCTLYQGLIDLL